MIIKGGSRENARFFAKHLTNTRENERVRPVEFRGFAQEDVAGAFREMEAEARGTRCKNYFYVISMNPEPGEVLTDEEWERAEDIAEEKLGLEGQPRFVIEHEKRGRIHRHVAWSRVDADSMTVRGDSLTYAKHEAASREIEKELDLKPVSSVLVKDRDTPRPKRRPKDYEGFRGSKSGIDPLIVKAEVTALWHESDNGASFRTALAERGYLLCRGDRRDYCLLDPCGDDHSLARRIDGVRAADIAKRMADIDRETLPTVAEGRLERRGDKKRVLEAVEGGADKANLERAINAGRAAEVMPQVEDGSGGRPCEPYERTFSQRWRQKDATSPEPPPGRSRPNWQERSERERGEREPE